MAPSNSAAVRDADAVLLCVPLRDTAKVTREVALHLKEGAIIIEMTSVKTGARGDVKGALKRKRARKVSIHPMFGPHSTAARPKILVLGGPGAMARSKEVFPWANLIPLGRRDHDLLMAYALSLIHAVNTAFAAAVSKRMRFEEFQRISSPFASAQMTLAKAVLSQDPALKASIQVENPHSAEAISAMIEELRVLHGLVEGKKESELRRRFASLAKKFPPGELEDALDQIYRSPG